MKPSPIKRRWFWGAVLGLFLLGGCGEPLPTPVLGTPTPTPFRPVYGFPWSTPTPFWGNPVVQPTLTRSPDTPTPFLGEWPLPSPPVPTPPASWPRPVEPSPTDIPEPAPLVTDAGTWTFLLLGSDRRGRTFRTDVMLLLALRAREGTVSLISFPRDLYVYIPGWRMQRLNAAYFRGEYSGYPGGGPQLLRDTFLYNFGIRVDYIALVDFEGFRAIVDTLGGIQVPVACAYTDWRLKEPGLDPQDPENWALYTVHPGLVWMDGDTALWYVRARKRSSDFSRHRRQQEVLLALRNRLLDPKNWARLPALYRTLQTYVETDLTWPKALPFLALLPRVDLRHLRYYRIRPPLVTYWRTPQGASVLLPRRGRLQEMLREALGPPPGRTAPPSQVVVAIRNASDRVGWDHLAAWRLETAGYETQILEPARTPWERSALYPLHGREEEGSRLLAYLGLPDSALRSVGQRISEGIRADWLLVLGQDYDPCFDPAQPMED